MYERSAIVLEKNFNTILGFDQKINLKTIYKDFKESPSARNMNTNKNLAKTCE